MKKISVLWLAHYVWDPRIYYKQVLSLSKENKVNCFWWSFSIKNDSWSDNWIENIVVNWNRLSVIINTLRYLLKNKSDLYVAHDLDSYIVLVLLKLIKWNSKIIFDSHEYYEEMWKMNQISFSHKVVYFVFTFILKPLTIRLFTAVTVISDLMLDKYTWVSNKEIIYNFPLTWFSENLKEIKSERFNDKFILVFQWWLTKVRWIFEYVLMLEKLIKVIPNIHLLIIWWFKDKKYEQKVFDYVSDNNLSEYVTFTWQIPLEEVYSYDLISHIWLNLLESNFNNNYWIQLKMFEYMFLELPSIWTNNTKYYKEFIVKNWCWEVIESVWSIDQWFDMIIKMKNNYDFYKWNCKKYKNSYTWDNEEKKLLSFYNSILND